MVDKFKAMLKSRRFWVAVSGVVVVASNTIFGEGTVAPETIQYAVLLAAAWIVGDSLRVTE